MTRSVFIGLPAYGQIASTQTVSSLMELAKRLRHHGFDYLFSAYSYPDIADTRNMLATIWLEKSPAEWMLQVDSDMRFESQMVLDMLTFGKPLTGCLYPMKRHPIEFVGTLDLSKRPQLRDGFIRVQAIGFGVTLIHRSAIEAMLSSGEAQFVTPRGRVAGRMMADFGLTRMLRAFDKIEVDDYHLSEDYSFCQRFTNSGGEIWASIAHRVGHVGQTEFTGRFADRVAQSGRMSNAIGSAA